MSLFGLELEDVSLTAFVTCEDARMLVDSAEDAWGKGERVEATADLADAFETLIRDYEQRKMLGHRVSVFDTAADMTMDSAFFRRVTGKQARFEDKVVESLKALDFAVMLVGLGIDFRRYGMFKAHTPHIMRTINGTRHIAERRGAPEPSQKTYNFCRDFVVSTALRLADFDYDLDWPGAHLAAVRQKVEDAATEPDADNTTTT